MQQTTFLRKNLLLDDLLDKREQIEDMTFWQKLNPCSEVSDWQLSVLPDSTNLSRQLISYTDQLQEEGYFQTAPLIPAAMQREMLECITTVRKYGFPAIFALVYDVFYKAFAYFDAILTRFLGSGYFLVPNFWVYYIEPSDTGKGFEPHRDAEYADTIREDGLPKVLTLWVTVTEATPLNSCMYMVPKNRDPQYHQAIHDLETGATQFALEDIRALPTQAGTLSCWDQYVYHWGSRSSKRAPAPRVSYALYCQRGDMAAVDSTVIDLRKGIDFETRLGLICKSMYRYSYLNVPSRSTLTDPLLSFLKGHMANLTIS